MKYILFILPLLLIGCVKDHSVVFFPTGDVGYEINCKSKSPGECFNSAAELCGGKYKVLDQYSQWTNQPTISPNLLVMCEN